MDNLNDKLKVKVMANPQTGEVWTPRVITDSNTGEEIEAAVIMLSQVTINSSGIGGLAKRTAFKTYRQEVVDLLGPLVDGQTFPLEGKLVVTETLTPYQRKDGSFQEPKRRGKGGEVITYNGQPVYRNTDFTEDMDAQDVLLRQSSAPQATAREVPAFVEENNATE